MRFTGGRAGRKCGVKVTKVLCMYQPINAVPTVRHMIRSLSKRRQNTTSQVSAVGWGL